MVFAYSKEAVGRLESDLCAAQARIRELETELRKAGWETEGEIQQKRALESDVKMLEAELEKLNTAIASWLKEEEVWRKAEGNLGAALARKDAALAAAEELIVRIGLFNKGTNDYRKVYIAQEDGDEDQITLGLAMNLLCGWSDELNKQAQDARALIAAALKAEKV